MATILILLAGIMKKVNSGNKQTKKEFWPGSVTNYIILFFYFQKIKCMIAY